MNEMIWFVDGVPIRAHSLRSHWWHEYIEYAECGGRVWWWSWS